MLIVRDIPSQPLEPCVAAIGFFDGVHLGHRYLIEQVGEVAAAKGLRTALITFPVHPRKVMNNEYNPELLTTYDEKLALLAQTDIDYCLTLDFTPEISMLTAHDFMRDVLRECYKVQALVIGYDHRFGHNRSEGFDEYVTFGQELGIDVIRARARTINHTTISSSVIRRLLHAGEVGSAGAYLGYDYFLDGLVVNGYKVGRTIGFPTANLRPYDTDKLIPGDGVYAVRVTVEGTVYAGMLDIGYRPTLNNGGDRSIEVHILHFHSDIYDCPIRISFVQRIRSDIKFPGIQELIEQLHKDAQIVEDLLLR